MNFVMLLLWPKSVKCQVNKWVQLAVVKSQVKLNLTGIGPFGYVTSKRRSLEKLACGHGENLVLMLPPK